MNGKRDSMKIEHSEAAERWEAHVDRQRARRACL
jgi:hypothetical protein